LPDYRGRASKNRKSTAYSGKRKQDIPPKPIRFRRYTLLLSCFMLFFYQKQPAYQFRLSVTPSLGFLMAAWAAASRAMGTRKGEQET